MRPSRATPTRRAARAAAIALAAALLSAPPLHAEDTGCEEGRAITAGLCASAELTLDTIANVSGGVRRGIAADAQARVALHADFETLLGLEGWQGEVSAFGIYGRQPTATLVGSLAPASNIEALSTVRLFELWLERSFGDYGSIRFGQLSADSEFATTRFGGGLVNGTFGWAVALAGALPSGGPAYPLATPGIRLNVGQPDEASGLRIAMFSGDPGGKYGEETDPQRHNRYGTTFSTAGGIFYIGEAVTGGTAPEGEDEPRPWVLKIGGWYHNGGFDSVRYDDTGLPLGDPASSGTPRRYHDNYGGYAVGEVVLWRGNGSNLGAFTRAFSQPGDRNEIAFQLDGGLAWHGPFGRGDDTLSFGVSWAKVGDASRDADRDAIAWGTDRPVRNYETVVELNYDYSVIPDHLSLRPVAQVMFNPAAREPDERRNPDRALPDAVLLGMRLVATF